MPCEKVCFTKEQALKILEGKKKSRKQYRNEKRCYYCHEHDSWHLTSREKYLPQTDIKLKFKKKWNKLMKNQDRQISICLTTYKRVPETIRAIEQLLDDGRIREFIILDDASPDDSYEVLRDYYKGNAKIKVLRQLTNKNMSRNKNDVLSYATCQFALIGDSDNIFTPSYLDAFFKLTKWDENTIYQPSAGEPNFDWSKYEGLIINKNNISDCMGDALFRCSLNGCNYIVNPKLYNKRYVYNPDIDAADTIHFMYNWLLQGGNYYIVPGMKYLHTVGEHSGFLRNLNKNMADAIALENKIKELR